METKVKKFSKKLLALFLAVVMVMTCFGSTLSAFAASKDVGYTDDLVEYNDLAWAVLSDEQAATALLDYVDVMLEQFGPTIDETLADVIGGLGTSVVSWDANERAIKLSAVVVNETIYIHLHSVDEILYTLESVEGVLRRRSSLLGDAGNIQLSSTAGMRRDNTSSCDIIRGILGILQKNSADYNGKDVLGEFLRGGFDLGTVGDLVSIDIYGLIGGLIGAPDGYESNLVYNLVQSLLFNNTNWFTEEEKAAYLDGSVPFVYDEVLLEKLSTKLLQSINVEVTYPYGTTSSRDRYQEIVAAGGDKSINGYDPKLQYTEDGNVYIFQYEGIDPLVLTKSDSLFDFGYRALKLAWNTVLKDTVGTIHVNSDVDRGHGANFDNVYYYWASENIDWVADINDPAFANNYSRENLEAWANSLVEVTDPETQEVSEVPVYQSYSAESVEQFLDEFVAETFEYDREAKGEGTWEDINSGQLFGKLRYSPLADFGFNMTTGPINLYFLQTGYTHLDEFFSTQYDNYDSMVAGFNDALVAAVKDIFINSDVRTNVYGDAAYPALNTTGNLTTIDSSAIQTIVNTLVGNALDVLQYTADSSDSTILKAFYDDKGPKAQLTEENLESAMIPLLIACIGNVNLNGFPLSECIHPEDWDKCDDAEAVAFVALREYLSYILPDKDYNVLVSEDPDGSYNATLEGTILPMARDAVVYVMQGIVPVTDADGNKWDVKTSEVTDDATIFELLNSVIVYYGGEYKFENQSITVDTGAMAIGALLGLCDNDGKSVIKNDSTSTLWYNIDLIANTLAPVLGTLQYGDSSKYGDFDSYELLYNDVIKGLFEISDTSHSTGMGGVSNFLYRLLTIVSAEPIQSTPITHTIYDLVADFFNALFGARYEGQGWTTVIPARSSDTPFDDLLQRTTIAGTDGSNVGALQKAICNFVEFTGYSLSGPKTYPDSVLRGIMFGLQAVNSFIPEAISPLSDFELKLPTVEFTNPSILGLAVGASTNDSIVISNNSTGINTAYFSNGELVQNERYFIKVKNITIAGDGTSSIGSYTSGAIINPGENLTVSTTTQVANNATSTSKYKVTVTYDILLGKDSAEPAFENLTTVAYQYLSAQQSWEDVVYPADRGGMLPQALESDNQAQTMTYNGYRAFTTDQYGDVLVGYPEYIVLSNDNLSAVEKYQYRMRNNSNGWFGDDRSIDGFYCYDVKNGIYDDKSGQSVSVGVDNAIPVFDKETGDLLNMQKIDVLIYKVKDGVTTYYDVNGSQISGSADNEPWQRNGVTGYDIGYDATLNTSLNGSNTSGDLYLIKTRNHVAYTLEEAYASNIIQAAHKNALGIYEYVYMKTGSGLNYDTTLGQISAKGPVDGIYIAQGKTTVGKGSSMYTTDLFKYDGETDIATGTYPINLRCYRSDGNVITTAVPSRQSYLVIGSKEGASEVLAKTNEIQSIVSNYRPSDFVAIDETIGGKHYTEASVLAEDAIYNALSVNAAPMTPTTALELADKSQLSSNVSVVTTEYGDRAYVPFTESNIKSDYNPGGYDFPVDVIAAAYVGDGSTGVDGVYYFDEACTMPIYTNDPLTSAQVSNGKDPAGIEVIEGTDENAGKWYLRNAPSYAREWDTTTYTTPWYKISTDEYGQKVQATDGENLLYEQVQYVYRDKDSNKVNSDFEWLAKFPSTSYQIIENDGSSTDNRGLISQANDYLTYSLSIIEGAVDASVSNVAFTDISLVRNGLNNNNFDIVTYNKMVEVAKNVERQYTLDITYYDKTTEETITDENVPFSSFNGYINNSNITVEGVETDEEGNVIACSGAKVNASLSSVQIEVYKELFYTYLNNILERGYLGDQLEKEILCASGNEYSAMTAVAPTYDAEGAVETNGSIKFNSSVEVPFGALDENNNLVNEGSVVYEENIWNNYVNALANAVSIATKGNGDYEYKNPAAYNSADKAGYTCQVTNCYSADTALQAAEVALETATTINVAYNEGGYVTIDGVKADTQKQIAVPEGTTVTLDGVANEGYEFKGFVEENIVATETPEGETTYTLTTTGDSMTVTPIFESSTPTGFNVTASLVVATNSNGETNNTAVNGDYTITLYKQGTQEVVGEPYSFTSAEDANSFTLTAVPAGTYDMVITSDYSLDRKVTLIVTDKNISGAIIPIIACDFNGDGYITGADALSIYQDGAASEHNFMYDLNGDGYITGADALTVYSCGVVGSMPEITIQ